MAWPRASSALSSSLYIANRLPDPNPSMETTIPVRPKARLGIAAISLPPTSIDGTITAPAAAASRNRRLVTAMIVSPLVWNLSSEETFQCNLTVEETHNVRRGRDEKRYVRIRMDDESTW